MSTVRKGKVRLFDEVDETSFSAKKACINGGPLLSSAINKLNGRPYSQRYYEILENRKTLPVWQQKQELFQVLKANQSLILVGETGSGKATLVFLA